MVDVAKVSKRAFRLSASTALAAFTLLLWPAALLIERIPNAEGRAEYDAAIAFFFFGPALFAPVAALFSVGYFVKLRRVQYLVEFGLMAAFLILFFCFVRLP